MRGGCAEVGRRLRKYMGAGVGRAASLSHFSSSKHFSSPEHFTSPKHVLKLAWSTTLQRAPKKWVFRKAEVFNFGKSDEIPVAEIRWLQQSERPGKNVLLRPPTKVPVHATLTDSRGKVGCAPYKCRRMSVALMG
eukprot:6186658-Pleurochrysis_carterae.AAC.3